MKIYNYIHVNKKLSSFPNSDDPCASAAKERACSRRVPVCWLEKPLVLP